MSLCKVYLYINKYKIYVVQVVAKALVRLLRSHYEVQAIVLNSIASMTVQVCVCVVCVCLSTGVCLHAIAPTNLHDRSIVCL